jgi:hypothetical protein
MVAKIKARYKGKDGEFYEGIPAADLDEEQYAALTTEQKHDVRFGGLYAMVEDKPAEKAPAEGAQPPAGTAEPKGSG